MLFRPVALFAFLSLCTSCISLLTSQHQKTVQVKPVPESPSSKIRLTLVGNFSWSGIVYDNGEVVGAYGNIDKFLDEKRVFEWQVSPGKHKIEVKQSKTETCFFWQDECINDQSNTLIETDKPSLNI